MPLIVLSTSTTRTRSLAALALVALAVQTVRVSVLTAAEPQVFKFPFNTKKTEQEMSFADDGTFVFCSAKQESALSKDDELDIYISHYDGASKTFTDRESCHSSCTLERCTWPHVCNSQHQSTMLPTRRSRKHGPGHQLCAEQD